MSGSNAKSGDAPPVIIIKKKKVVGGHAHHGGAWKVAYADFVTAMMAFFLLLWLVSVTTEEQLSGIADYFTPTRISSSQSGSGGMFGGVTIGQPGALDSPSSPISPHRSMPGQPEVGVESNNLDAGNVTNPASEVGEVGRQGENEFENNSEFQYEGSSAQEFNGTNTQEGNASQNVQNNAQDGAQSELERLLVEHESRQFEQAAAMLRQAIQSNPQLLELEQSLIVDETREGLRIQIVDQEQYSMFPSGSSQLYGRSEQLMELVAQVVEQVDNDISITGHTDSTPFSGVREGYGNWELSTDRANASRRALVDAGLPEERISHVIGKADTDHLFPNNPDSPRNRRISIVLLRENLPPADISP